MKRSILLISCLIGSAVSFGQVINTFPFNEDFETQPTGPTGCGPSYTFTGNTWTNGDDANPVSPTHQVDWTVDNGGTGSGGTGPSIDHTLGTAAGNYIYMETSCSGTGYPSISFDLVSPYLDFTTLTAPTLKFWRHMLGADGGEMRIDVSTTNNGVTTIDNNVIPAIANPNLDQWIEETVLLNAYAGMDSVRIFIRGISGTNFTADFGLDDISVFQPAPVDVALTSIDNLPADGCGLGTYGIGATITQVGATGLSAGDTLIISYNDGTNSITDTVVLTSAIGPGGVYNHLFSLPVDYSIPGTYNIVVDVATSADPNLGDNTSTAVLNSIPTISTFPYIETFEADNGQWSSSGAGDVWEWGIPANSIINSAAGCGTNAWVTNLTGDYNNNSMNYLESPCMDMSTLTVDPTIRFDFIFETETNFDEAWLEMTVDNGVTWTKVGTSGTGLNWYNDATNEWWEGSSNGWVIAENTLTGAAGQSAVRVRFAFSSDGSVVREGLGVDNIMIFNSIIDVAASNVVAPVSGCGLSAGETVMGDFTNFGSDTLFTLNVCYSINGGTAVCETINDTILPGDTYTHMFSTTADLSASGTYTVSTWTSTTGDVNTCNDSTAVSVTNITTISSYPHIQDFENGPGDWIENNSNNGSWAFGTPAKNTIIGASSGSNAWVTGGLGTGTYSANDDSHVLSPCFDFTTLDTGSYVSMRVWWNSEFSWDGANLQITTDDGATWNNIGAFGDPLNWYTDNTINGTPGGSQEGWSGRNSTGNGSGGWVYAIHTLDTALVGLPSARFRVNFGSDGSVQDDGFGFDDFKIGLPDPLDTTLADYTGCAPYAVDYGKPGIYDWYIQDTSTLAVTQVGSTTTSTFEFENTSNLDSTFNAIVVYTDYLGLQTTDTVLMTLQPGPTVSLNDTTICSYDSAIFSVDTASYYSYLWSDASTSDSATFNSAGMVSVTVTNVNSGCFDTDSAMIYMTAPVDVPTTANVCAGDSLMVDAGNYSTYSWSTGDSTQTIYVSAVGTYTIDVVDSLGCMYADSIEITTSMPMPAITGAVDTLCANQTMTLDAGSGFSSYTWTSGGSAQSELIDGSTLALGSNTITVSVTDANGCSNTDAITFIVDGCAGIDELDDVTMTLYPNPSEGIFNYSIAGVSGTISMNVTDVFGKVVMNANSVNTNGAIDLSNVESGIYFLNIQHNDTVTSVRLIKK